MSRVQIKAAQAEAVVTDQPDQAKLAHLHPVRFAKHQRHRHALALNKAPDPSQLL